MDTFHTVRYLDKFDRYANTNTYICDLEPSIDIYIQIGQGRVTQVKYEVRQANEAYGKIRTEGKCLPGLKVQRELITGQGEIDQNNGNQGKKICNM